MEPFFVIVALAVGSLSLGAASLVYAFRRSSKREREAAFAHISDTYNLTVMNPKRLEGDVRGYRVFVTLAPHVQVRIELKGLLVSTLSIANEATARKNTVHYHRLEHEVGDESFDSLAHIQGDESLLAALLSVPVRAEITHLIKTYEAIIDGGFITCAVDSSAQAIDRWASRVDVDDLEHVLAPPIRECIEEAVKVAELMHISEDDQPGRIAHNVVTDPSAEFRLWCFNVFIRFYRDHPNFLNSFASVCQTSHQGYVSRRPHTFLRAVLAPLEKSLWMIQ